MPAFAKPPLLTRLSRDYDDAHVDNDYDDDIDNDDDEDD